MILSSTIFAAPQLVSAAAPQFALAVALDWSYLTVAVALLAALSILFGVGLAIASRVFAVHVDQRVEAIEGALPGANCGACGFGGCAAYAAAVAEGKTGPGECLPGGLAVARQIAAIMGLDTDAAGKSDKRVAVVLCQGGAKEATERFQYHGIADCRAAALVQDGAKGCRWACLGLASCVKSCPFDAIRMGPDGLPQIIEENCVACGTCVDVCPKQVLALLPLRNKVHVLCRNRDKGAETRRVCSVGCIGCHKCEKVCPVEGSAVHVSGNLAKIDPATCISCGKCPPVCPMATIANFRLSRLSRKDTLSAQQQALL